MEKPKPEDTKQIRELYKKVWLSTYPNVDFGITEEDIAERFKDSLSKESIEKWAKFYLSIPENQFFLVAKHDGEIVGVCTAVKHVDYNELKSIYVLREYQNKGIGSRMFEKVMEWFDKKKKIIVRVVSYNTQAINFYKKLGFVETNNKVNSEVAKLPSGKILPEIEMVLE